MHHEGELTLKKVYLIKSNLISHFLSTFLGVYVLALNSSSMHRDRSIVQCQKNMSRRRRLVTISEEKKISLFNKLTKC